LKKKIRLLKRGRENTSFHLIFFGIVFLGQLPAKILTDSISASKTCSTGQSKQTLQERDEAGEVSFPFPSCMAKKERLTV